MTEDKATLLPTIKFKTRQPEPEAKPQQPLRKSAPRPHRLGVQFCRCCQQPLMRPTSSGYCQQCNHTVRWFTDRNKALQDELTALKAELYQLRSYIEYQEAKEGEHDG